MLKLTRIVVSRDPECGVLHFGGIQQLTCRAVSASAAGGIVWGLYTSVAYFIVFSLTLNAYAIMHVGAFFIMEGQ